MDISSCPDCRERIRIERLAHGWRFCATCGIAWLVDESGKIFRQLTNHSPAYSARTCALSTEPRAADA